MTFSSRADDEESEAASQRRRVPARPGLNRFVWDMRYPDARKVAGDLITENAVVGPLAVPGTYQVQLKVGDQLDRQSFEIQKDPRLTVDQAAFAAQFKLGLEIRDKISETNDAVNRLRRVRGQIEAWVTNLTEAQNQRGVDLETVSAAAQSLQEKLTTIESELIQTGAKSGSDRLRLRARLNGKLTALTSVVSSADEAPTQQTYDVFEHLSAQVDDQLAQLEQVISADLADFNRLLQEANVPAVVT